MFRSINANIYSLQHFYTLEPETLWRPSSTETSLSLHLERVGDHHCNDPDYGADTLGGSCGPTPMERTGRMDNCQVPIYTDAERRGRRMRWCNGRWTKRVLHPPGQEEYAAVHVDEVAEGVNVGARLAPPTTMVQSDASWQRQRHQQVGHCKVDGVDHGGRGRRGGTAEDVESQAVEEHADHHHHAVTHLPQREAE